MFPMLAMMQAPVSASRLRHLPNNSTSRAELSSARPDSSRFSLSRAPSFRSVELDRPTQRNTAHSNQQDEEDAYLIKLLRQGGPTPEGASEPQLPRPRKRSKSSPGSQPSASGTRSKTCSTRKSAGSTPGVHLRHETGSPAPQKPSEVLRTALGNEQYNEVRATVLRHQEAFLTQLYELHRIVQLQRHLVGVCDKPDAMTAELAKLEAEQLLRPHDTSEVTVEQAQQEAKEAARKQKPEQLARASSQPCAPADHPKAQLPSTPAEAAPSAGGSMRPPNQQVPYPAYGPAAWSGMYGRGYSMPYGPPGMPPGMGFDSFPSWGMSMGSGQFPGTFANPYGGSMGMMGGAPMDPMMAWYMMHYGQYAHAMHSAAHARMQAREQQQNAADAAVPEQRKGASQGNLRWWQDPEKVFGIAANPAVIAQPILNQSPVRRQEMQTEATSKPNVLKRQRASADGSAEPPGSGAAQRQSQIHITGGSLGSHPIPAVEAPQKTGSGVSAFKKLPTKSPKIRRPPTRAESIGSEVSRSAAERSHVDEGESSGVAHGVAKARAASGPTNPQPSS